MNCERCTAATSGYQLFDYCASCSKNLCEKCMAKGCCGRAPAASGSSDLDAEISDLTREHAERQKQLSAEPEAIDADHYQQMLEVLPPARWIGGAFLVGEAMSHDDNGQARYAYYFRRGDQHFHGADLTVPEFEAKHGKGG